MTSDPIRSSQESVQAESEASGSLKLLSSSCREQSDGRQRSNSYGSSNLNIGKTEQGGFALDSSDNVFESGSSVNGSNYDYVERHKFAAPG